MNRMAIQKAKEIFCSFFVYLLIASSFIAINYFTYYFSRSGTENLQFYYFSSNCFTFIYILIMYCIYFSFSKAVSVTIYILSNIVFFALSLSQVLFLRILGRVYGISDLLYTSEGTAFFGAVKEYFDFPLVKGLLGILFLTLLTVGVMIIAPKVKAPRFHKRICVISTLAVCILIRISVVANIGTPFKKGAWDNWNNQRYIYSTYCNPQMALELSGIYEYAVRSLYLYIEDNMKSGVDELVCEINDFFDSREIENEVNHYTGIFEDKNIIMIMMESIDEWQVTKEVMPTISGLMETGINFNNYYAPFYGSGATINSEFAALTGLFKSSDMTDFSDISQKIYPYSLPNLFKNKGYTVNSVHFNHGTFYNRKTLHRNIGFDHHYALADDSNVVHNPGLDSNLAREDYVYNLIAPKQERKFMTFLTTYTPHFPYETTNYFYNVLTKDGLRDELIAEGDDKRTVLNVLSNETDNFVKILMERLSEDGLLNDTVIVLFSDHYNYGYADDETIGNFKNTSGNLIYRVPFVIWSRDVMHETVSIPAATNNILPTLSNMFNLDYGAKNYLKADIFSSGHNRLIYFFDYSWFDGTTYSADVNDIDEEYILASQYVNEAIKINNAILKSNYYAGIQR